MNFSQLGFGSFSIGTHGIFLSIIFTFCLWRYYKKLQLQKLPVNFFVHHFWKWLLAGILSGRLLVLLLEPQVILDYTWASFFVFWEGGMSFIGFLIGFLAFLHFDTKSTQFTVWRWVDLAIFPFLVAIMWNDIASFITGNVYGTVANLPWAIQYETFTVDTIDPVHPVTLYGLVLHGVLWWWFQKHEQFYLRFPGKLSTVFGIVFFGIEFLLFFLRGDIDNTIFGTLKIEQLFHIGIVCFLLFSLRKRNLSFTKGGA